MKLNTNSNTYIIIYSAILVVIVAFLLAFVYQALKPMQDANVALDVKKQILYSLNIRDLDGAEAEAKYAEVVKEEAEKDGQKYYLCEIDGEDILVVALDSGVESAVTSPSMVMRRPPSMEPISIMRVRRPVWEQRLRTLRNGRRSSSARRSLSMALRMWLSLL